MAKRMRFGLVFRFAEKVGDDLLNLLHVKKAEGCIKDGQNFAMITTVKPCKVVDIVKGIAVFNQDRQEKLVCVPYADGPEVAVFDKGNAFREHAIYKVIEEMRNDASYWSWFLGGGGAKKKRVLGELESDLVQSSFTPVSSKRVSTGTDEAEPEEESKKTSSKTVKRIKPAPLREEILVHMLVKEVTRSKDETIQAKNQMIELLMSKKCNCAA